MIRSEVLKKTEVNAADILDAAKTIPTNDAHTCDWIDDQWLSPERYLEWAKISFKGGDDQRLVSTVAHSKRAVCRVIDTLVLTYHMEYAKKCNYPMKINGLMSIGINVDSIVQELIIDPRNELEHEYKVPEPKQANRAVQVAGLFVAAMKAELERKPIIAFNWNVQFMHSSTKTEEVIEFKGLHANPMFLIDVFGEHTEIKIVDPQAAEVRYARLNDFSKDDCLMLGTYLRSHYTHKKNWGEFHMPETIYGALKSQAGL
jgi:hypothetical protein